MQFEKRSGRIDATPGTVRLQSGGRRAAVSEARVRIVNKLVKDTGMTLSEVARNMASGSDRVNLFKIKTKHIPKMVFSYLRIPFLPSKYWF